MAIGIISIIYRSLRKLRLKISKPIYKVITFSKLSGNGVIFHRNLVCNGVPIIDVHRSGTCELGEFCAINSGEKFNPIGRYSPTYIIVRENAKLRIGDYTGLSNTAIICHKEIIIGKYVKFGGNVVIYDTDFHSLDYIQRREFSIDKQNTVCKSVNINDDVFIGAHSTILKGVTIGRGAIVGAGSLVAKDIPEFEIWGGNPAKFIKAIK